MKTGLREQIKNAPDAETIARLVRELVSAGYPARYFKRCAGTADKRLRTLASKKGGGK